MKKLTLCLAVYLLALTACSPNASSAIEGEWRLVSYGDPADPTPAATDVETSVIFGSNGQVHGNVGCNGFGGDYEVDGDTINFGPIVATLMFCEGPVGEQETVLLRVFQETTSYGIDGDTLTITSSDGSDLVVIEKK